jgi:hypothetical protein
MDYLHTFGVFVKIYNPYVMLSAMGVLFSAFFYEVILTNNNLPQMESKVFDKLLPATMWAWIASSTAYVLTHFLVR